MKSFFNSRSSATFATIQRQPKAILAFICSLTSTCTTPGHCNTGIRNGCVTGVTLAPLFRLVSQILWHHNKTTWVEHLAIATACHKSKIRWECQLAKSIEASLLGGVESILLECLLHRAFLLTIVCANKSISLSFACTQWQQVITFGEFDACIEFDSGPEVDFWCLVIISTGISSFEWRFSDAAKSGRNSTW